MSRVSINLPSGRGTLMPGSAGLMRQEDGRAVKTCLKAGVHVLTLQ